MGAQIAREVGMEGREPEVVRTSEQGHTVELGENLDAPADTLDDGGADEDAGEVAVGEAADRERRLERLALAAVAIAPHRDVEHAERRLAGATVDHLGGAQDQSGAGPQPRHTLPYPPRHRCP